MQQRCPNSTPFLNGVLEDHQLECFHWMDIIEKPGGKVHGAVYVIDTDDLKKLDQYEEYPTAYERKQVSIRGIDKRLYQCVVYYMLEKLPLAPCPEYVATVNQGYLDWNLPLKQLEEAWSRSQIRVSEA